MKFEKKVIFVASSKRESKGSTYHNVTIEDSESGEIFTLSCDENATAGLTKYTPYICVFQYSEFRGDGRIRVAGFLRCDAENHQSTKKAS